MQPEMVKLNAKSVNKQLNNTKVCRTIHILILGPIVFALQKFHSF